MARRIPLGWGLYQLARPASSDLAALADAQSSESVSYDQVGIALGTTTPAGYHRVDAERTLGTDEHLFAGARKAIEDWAGHERAGAVVEPARPDLQVGAVVALAMRVFPLWVTATCRIVDVIDEEHRFGFVYGTLPHHPASGEEAFLAIRDETTGRVSVEIRACSRLQSPLARLGGPVGRSLQRRVAERYLDGFEATARRADPSAGGR